MPQTEKKQNSTNYSNNMDDTPPTGNVGRHPSDAFWPRSQLVRQEHIPAQARFPVIDSHNHFWGRETPEALLSIMDKVGVKVFMNLTGNTGIFFDDQGYAIEPRDFHFFKEEVIDHHPGRFIACTMSGFARWGDLVLFDRDDFVERTIAQLEQDVRMGACGLKVLKQLGLQFMDRDGSIIRVDDDRLDPIWRRAGELGVPVLIHTADPIAFFDPVDKNNEQYGTLLQYPGWSFHGSKYSFTELVGQRNRVIARHPGTTFVLPHLASYPENLGMVASWMDELPNIMLDFSARIDELGRQPYSTREFLIRYQGRVLFGTDTPVTAEMYQCYFRWLETSDEDFVYPNYNGEWDGTRWKICGLHLPDEVLKKIYHQNSLRLYPCIDDRMFA